MGWLAAIGNYELGKIKQKYTGTGDPSQQNQPQDPNQPMDIAPDPTQSTLGYQKYRAQHTPLGQAISGGMNRYRQHRADQAVQSNANEQFDPSQLPQPAPQGDPDLAGLQPEMMARGRMVTKPTVALLGESGPEAVVPMNGNPANKVSMPPMPMPHQRYRR